MDATKVPELLQERLKILVELVGAAAILVGLLFVGFELRQNTAAVQADTLQNLTELTTSSMYLLASDKELARINSKGFDDFASLDESEARQFFQLRRASWIRIQMAFLQWRQGTLNDEAWEFYGQFLCQYYAVGDWPIHKDILLENFVELVEACH